jgi:hypothetical protein
MQVLMVLGFGISGEFVLSFVSLFFSFLSSKKIFSIIWCMRQKKGWKKKNEKSYNKLPEVEKEI